MLIVPDIFVTDPFTKKTGLDNGTIKFTTLRVDDAKPRICHKWWIVLAIF